MKRKRYCTGRTPRRHPEPLRSTLVPCNDGPVMTREELLAAYNFEVRRGRDGKLYATRKPPKCASAAETDSVRVVMPAASQQSKKHDPLARVRSLFRHSLARRVA